MIVRALLLLAAVAASSGAAARPDPARYMDAELVAETAAPKPGTTMLVGFRFTPKPGWHGYWSNPGDSGIAPTVRWTAPKRVTLGPLLHPAPTLISAAGIDSFVHEGPHVLLARMTIARSIAPGTPIPVKADLSWAACTVTQCVPLRASFTLDLIAGAGAPGSHASLLRAASAKLPRPVTGATFAVEGSCLRLRLPPSLKLNAGKTRFFPDEGGYFDSGAARSAAREGMVVIEAPAKGEAPAFLSGVVSDGVRSYRMKAAPAAASGEADAPSIVETAAASAAVAEAPRPQAADANNAAVNPVSTNAGEPRSGRKRGLWLFLAILMPVAAAGWLWHRRSS
jgi:DsbC/DsbD-like thiol-disulfide interchange protein